MLLVRSNLALLRCNLVRANHTNKVHHPTKSSFFHTSTTTCMAKNASTSSYYPNNLSFIASNQTNTYSLVLLVCPIVFSSLVANNNDATTKCDDDKEDDKKDVLAKITKSVKELWEKGDYATILDTGATHLGAQVQGMIDSGVPSQISSGFVCGFCSGYAMKKIGRSGAVVFGTGFMIMQGLSYTGYIQVNYERLSNDFQSIMDVNGDGKVDKEDAQHAYEKVMDVLTFNMPAGSGFGGGFLAGLKSG